MVWLVDFEDDMSGLDHGWAGYSVLSVGAYHDSGRNAQLDCCTTLEFVGAELLNVRFSAHHGQSRIPFVNVGKVESIFVRLREETFCQLVRFYNEKVEVLPVSRSLDVHDWLDDSPQLIASFAT